VNLDLFSPVKNKFKTIAHLIFSRIDKETLKQALCFCVLLGLLVLTVTILIGTYNFNILKPRPSFSIVSLATILASLLAISFSISLVTVQIVSNIYTSRILDVYKKNPIVIATISIFLGSIIGLLLLSTIPAPSKTLCAICFGWFFLCCILLLIFFFEVLSIIDSLKLAKILEGSGKTAILAKKFEEAELEISCIGDIILKTIDRNEEETSKKYLEVLSKYIETYSSLPDDPQQSSSNNRNQKTKTDVLNSIFSEYFRIYRTTVKKDNLKIRDDLLEQIDSIFYTYYLSKEDIITQIQKFEVNSLIISIKKRDDIRHSIIFNYVTHIGTFIDRYTTPVNFEWSVNNELIKNYLDSGFLLINKEIIKNDDYDLFESEMNAINGWFFSEPQLIINQIRDRLLHLTMAFSFADINPPFEQEFQNNVIILKHMSELDLLDNFENFKDADTKIRAFNKFIITGLNAVETDIKIEIGATVSQSKKDFLSDQLKLIKNRREVIKSEINKILILTYQYQVTSIFHRSLFVNGAAILKFEEYTDTKFGSKKYIRQLMGFPNLRNGIEWLNSPPIVKNADWLTHLFVYGGQNNNYWILNKGLQNNLDLNSDALIKTYLLAITSITSETDRHLSLPTLMDLEALYQNGENIDSISRYYAFSNSFLDKSDILTKTVDSFIEIAEQFEYLFGKQSKESFNNTKLWLDESYKRMAEVTKNIESTLPIDPEISKKYLQEISDNFDSIERIPRIVETRHFNPEIDYAKHFETLCNSQNLLSKRNFIKISRVPIVGLGRILAHSTIQWENDLIAQTILKYIDDKKTISGDSIKEKISYLSSIYSSIKSDSTILCSQKFLSLLKQNNLIKRRDKLDLGNNLFIRVCGSDKIPDEIFIIISKTAGVLISQIKESTGKRLFVTLEEDAEDKSRVKLLACIKVHFEILRIGEIQIIQFIPKNTESV